MVQGKSLNLIASMAGRFFRLTQFMRSYSHLLVDAISYIFSSKNADFDFFMQDLKDFQSSKQPDDLYLERDSEYSLFHHSLECLVICCSLEKVVQAELIICSMLRKKDSMSSRESKESEFRVAILEIKWEMKSVSLSLPCLMLLLMTLMSETLIWM